MTIQCKAVHAILLAAGLSRRMGTANKLLLPISGSPMLRNRVDMLLHTKVCGISVVLGHDIQHTAQILQGLPVNLLFNADYAAGRMSSVHYGLAHAAANDADGFLLCLADQPLLQAEDVDFLLDAFAQVESDAILVPEFAGQRGNPVLISSQHRIAILDYREMGGCRGFIDAHPQYIKRVAMPNAHVLQDVDTPEMYQQLKSIYTNL